MRAAVHVTRVAQRRRSCSRSRATARLPCHSQIDERSAGFFALGLAKATGRPAVVACTSGTAAANYAPAVDRGRSGRRAADRPDRRPPARAARGRRRADDRPDQALRRRVRWFVELGTHEHSGDRGAGCGRCLPRVLDDARRAGPGPVHLNFAAARAAGARRAAAASRSAGARATAVADPAAPGRAGHVDARRRRAASSSAGASSSAANAVAEAVARVRRGVGLAGARRPAVGRAPRRRMRSPTTTRCCATALSRRGRRPRRYSGSATCRRPSRCGHGWRRSTCAQVAMRPDAASGTTPTGSSSSCCETDPVSTRCGPPACRSRSRHGRPTGARPTTQRPGRSTRRSATSSAMPAVARELGRLRR